MRQEKPVIPTNSVATNVRKTCAMGRPAMPLPNGTVTFLFTDIEGSTKLWEDHPATRLPQTRVSIEAARRASVFWKS